MFSVCFLFYWDWLLNSHLWKAIYIAIEAWSAATSYFTNLIAKFCSLLFSTDRKWFNAKTLFLLKNLSSIPDLFYMYVNDLFHLLYK